ncbi:hypothetical protein QFZ74_001306 [Streptomyces sp. V3I7]|nr:hypothetical protein [Streptomyces sp. V3I7]
MRSDEGAPCSNEAESLGETDDNAAGGAPCSKSLGEVPDAASPA